MPNDISIPFAINIFTKGPVHHLESSFGLTPYLKGYKTFLKEDDLSDKQLYVSTVWATAIKNLIAALFFLLASLPLSP